MAKKKMEMKHKEKEKKGMSKAKEVVKVADKMMKGCCK